MNDTFMKEKPIFPLLTSMALPMVVSMLVNALYNIVDSLFVARISEEAMTALSLVYPVQNLINAIAIGFSIGIAALISLHLGAGNKEKADMAATHGMVLSLIHGVVISIVCTAIMPRFLRSFTSDETVIAMGVTYSRVAFMFAVVIMAAMSFEKIFQAVGRMNITMIGLMGGSVCNIILDPLLIFGIGPFPKMGIAGAALATGIGQMVPLIFYLIVCIQIIIYLTVFRNDITLYSSVLTFYLTICKLILLWNIFKFQVILSIYIFTPEIYTSTDFQIVRCNPVP